MGILTYLSNKQNRQTKICETTGRRHLSTSQGEDNPASPCSWAFDLHKYEKVNVCCLSQKTHKNQTMEVYHVPNWPKNIYRTLHPTTADCNVFQALLTHTILPYTSKMTIFWAIKQISIYSKRLKSYVVCFLNQMHLC